MERDFLKKQIALDFQNHKSSLYKINADFISSEMSNSRSSITVPLTVSKIERGKFYFVFYDMQGKISALEKWNPLFVIDWYDDGQTRQMFGISMNFIPVSIRTVFFNLLTNFNLNILEGNQELLINKQLPYSSITFGKMYKMLQSIGFEWAIRKFDIRKINKVWVLNTNNLSKFVTMSTYSFTGVDDNKLMEIWLKKLDTQKEREAEQLQKILGDYKQMQSELDQQYSTVSEKEDQLLLSLEQMKKL